MALPQANPTKRASKVQAKGAPQDTILAHINPQEASLLDQVTDGGSVNPRTGLLEFEHGASGDGENSDASNASGGASSFGTGGQFGGGFTDAN